jgi:hypothetical protein
MAAEYSITQTQPYDYLDRTRQVVHGFRVDFTIVAYNEDHFVLVPNLSAATVDQAIAPIVKDRKALGGPPGK